MEVVASLSEGGTAAAQCGLFTYKSIPVIFEPPCTLSVNSVEFDAEVSCFVSHILLNQMAAFVYSNFSLAFV